MKPKMAPENDPMVQELKRLNDIQEAQLNATVINEFGWYGICAILGRKHPLAVIIPLLFIVGIILGVVL